MKVLTVREVEKSQLEGLLLVCNQALCGYTGYFIEVDVTAYSASTISSAIVELQRGGWTASSRQRVSHNGYCWRRTGRILEIGLAQSRRRRRLAGSSVARIQAGRGDRLIKR